MDLHTVNLLSICTGIGGLDLGIGLALPGARTVCMVEGEAPACEILASKMDEGSLHPAPIWTNARTFDGRAWAGRVHGIVAGYPCQPFSVAGKRRGSDDPRHLWPEILRIAGEVGPEFLFLENVAGHVRLGLDRVLGDLAEVGFDTEWATFRASDVGAPHRRERVFILAYRRGGRLERIRQEYDINRGDALRRDADGCDAEVADAEGIHAQGLELRSRQVEPGRSRSEVADPRGDGRPPSGQGGNLRGLPGASIEALREGSERALPSECSEQQVGEDVADIRGQRLEGHGQGGSEEGTARRSCRADLADSDCGVDKRRRGPRDMDQAARAAEGEEEERQRSGPTPDDCGRGIHGQWPPGPDAEWQAVPEHLWPATEPTLRGVADGVPGRVDRLRALGNAVVPAQAALAFTELVRRVK